MEFSVDTREQILVIKEGIQEKRLPLYSKEAFQIVSDLWVKLGWNAKHTYTFSWMGRPIIQLPEDMIRIQEVIYNLKPDIILETGIAHGGSLIYYASLCKAMGKGRIVGVDIEIRPSNRKAIEEHELFQYITLIEGDSVAESTLKEIELQIKEDDIVLVILDSCHTKEHVRKEIERYKKFVTKDSYLIVTDGVMQDLYDVPRGEKEWIEDNPVEAIKEFLKETDQFIIESPKWVYNESQLTENISHWPFAWLKRK